FLFEFFRKARNWVRSKNEKNHLKPTDLSESRKNPSESSIRNCKNGALPPACSSTPPTMLTLFIGEGRLNTLSQAEKTAVDTARPTESNVPSRGTLSCCSLLNKRAAMCVSTLAPCPPESSTS